MDRVFRRLSDRTHRYLRNDGPLDLLWLAALGLIVTGTTMVWNLGGGILVVGLILLAIAIYASL